MNKVLLIFKIEYEYEKSMNKSNHLFQSMPECENINRDGEETEN